MDAVYRDDGPAACGLEAAVERAWRSPFLARKLEAAGFRRGEPLTWQRWWSIPPTRKDELRRLVRFEEEFCTAPRERVVEFWRSGGVTGRPLFYPRTQADVDVSLVAFARSLAIAGVTRDDTFMCSLPIGTHPAGQLMIRAAEILGAAGIWAGAGTQTPSITQIELIHDLGVTVWCGMASFGLHLAHLAEAAGRPLTETGVRRLVTTAEPLSRSKRALLEALWGARVVDVFGMSEITLFGAECERRRGLHVWTDHVFCEVIDPASLAPVGPGEPGILCVTALKGADATPFLRWLSGDVVHLEHGCDCAEADMPRLVHSGRTTDFFKVKGVNLNHGELEDALFAVPDIRDFRVIVTSSDRLRVEIECADGCGPSTSRAVDALLSERFGLRASVELLARGTIARANEGHLKARRFIDQRETASGGRGVA